MHKSTKYTPIYLEFGRELRLPNDIIEPIPEEQAPGDQSQFALDLKQRLDQAYKSAKAFLSSAHRAQKSYYDRWAKSKSYQTGDLVLWFDNKTRNGRCMKLNRPWTGPWEIIKKLNDVVYRVRYKGRERKGIKRRVVHYNQLKPFLGNEAPVTKTNAREENQRRPEPEGQHIFIEDEELYYQDLEPENDLLNHQEQPQNERPCRQRRPPAWLQDYEQEF